MHYHLEVIMPPSSNIEKALEEILAPFSEHNTDSENHSGHSFWDWYVIGGRWAGTKETCRYDAKKMEEFYKKLQDLKITVSGIQCGKQTLEPPSQIPDVDKLWNEFFPTEDGTITPCPVFSHSNNQYDSNDLLSCDICRVDEIADELTASRVIIACPGWRDDGSLQAEYMISDDMWNGVIHVDTTWDGKVKSAIDEQMKRVKRYKKEAQDKYTPKPDWICVTVDYHS